MNKRLAAILSLSTVMLGVMNVPAVFADSADADFALGSQPQTWRFKVSLDEREIGFHNFVVSRQGTQRTVDISADFDVKILFINAYSYDHANSEIWKDGCLQQIRSETDDNGKTLKVTGQSLSEGFTIVTQAGEPRTVDSPCVRSFAYWDPEFLGSNRLLNAQTGEIIDVDIESRGEETLLIDGDPVAAVRYVIEMDGGPITLWYTRDSSRWLALQAVTDGGRTLRYDPVQLPFPTRGEGSRLAGAASP